MKIGMLIGIFVGNLMVKILLGANWTEAIIVSLMATVICAVLMYFFLSRTTE